MISILIPAQSLMNAASSVRICQYSLQLNLLHVEQSACHTIQLVIVKDVFLLRLKQQRQPISLRQSCHEIQHIKMKFSSTPNSLEYPPPKPRDIHCWKFLMHFQVKPWIFTKGLSLLESLPPQTSRILHMSRCPYNFASVKG